MKRSTASRYFYFLLLIAFAGCDAQESIEAQTREEAAWDIREAVHRYQFEKYNEDNEQQVDYYFLSSGWQKEPSGTRKQRKDPPGKFLERFADQSPKIKPASMADVKGRRPPLPNSPSPAVVHKKNGKSGLIFGVDSMRWVNNNTVEVQGNYCGKTFAAGSTYRVKRSNGEWIVAKAEPRWIT